jgi:hydrogenase expression/formation protein HypE
MNELALQAGVGFVLDEAALPVRSEVRAACEILGIDPLHIANEGKLLAVVPGAEADAALAAMHAHPLGAQAALIGEATADGDSMVIVRTAIGGSRVLDMLVGDPLPRIC